MSLIVPRWNLRRSSDAGPMGIQRAAQNATEVLFGGDVGLE